MAKPLYGSRKRSIAATCVYFALATLAMVHPLFTWVGDRVEPRFMGLPFNLVYVLGWIALNSLVLTWMYRSRLVDAQELGPTSVEERQ